MSVIKKWLLAICAIILMNGCAPLRMPVIVRNAPIEMYKYAYISPTKELTSSTGGTYGGQYGIYGSSTTKSVNPSDVIAGILIKEGYIILPELKPELSNETLIVNYGESGRRNRGLGYTIEVTIQFSSAKTNEMICSCTAEGQGETEADDIRQAIRRALENSHSGGINPAFHFGIPSVLPVPLSLGCDLRIVQPDCISPVSDR